jgi:hypothetical protein
LRCPKCGRADQLRAVPAIFSDESPREDDSDSSAAVNAPPAENKLFAADDNPSLLRLTLAPPAKPTAAEATRWGTMGSIVFIAGGICSAVSAVALAWPVLSAGEINSQFIQLMISVVFALAIAAGGFATLRSSRKKAALRQARIAAQIPRWEAAMARWNRLYYCTRDKGVFDPAENTFVPAEEMVEYIDN